MQGDRLTEVTSSFKSWTQLTTRTDDVVAVVAANSTADATVAVFPPIGADSPLLGFNAWYQQIHGYLSLAVCAFGIASNAMNIAVLTRRSMISPTNYLLTALATADIGVMLFYVPYAAYFYCIAMPDPHYGHGIGWIYYLMFNTNFNITAHTTTMWLTVSLAVFRYIAVCHPLLGARWCNLRRARITVAAVVLATVVFCIPNYMMLQAVPYESGGYWFRDNDFMTTIVKSLYFWLFGVALKVVPCILLAVLSALLVRAMRKAEKRRRLLKMKGRRLESETAGDYNRTTSMLVAVVLCTVVTELPQGILAFLSGIDNDVFLKVYVPLGDVWDMVVLVNSAVNFLLYCTMSHQFRRIFSELFIGPCRVAAARLFPDTNQALYSAQIGTIKLENVGRTLDVTMTV